MTSNSRPVSRPEASGVNAGSSSNYSRPMVLGEGLSTMMQVGGRVQHRDFKQSLITGTGPSVPEDSMVRPVQMVPKRNPPPKGHPGPEAHILAEHAENLKRAQMRSLRAAVDREKHGGPGRSIRPRPAPINYMAAATPTPAPAAPNFFAVGVAQGAQGSSFADLSQSQQGVGEDQPRSPRTNNARLGSTKAVANGFFGSTGARGQRMVGAGTQTDSKPQSAAAAAKPAKTLQFAADTDAVAPAREQPASTSGHGATTTHVLSLEGQKSNASVASTSVGLGSSLFGISKMPTGPVAPVHVDLDLSETWNRNSKISKGLYKRAGTYSPEEEEKMTFATSYNEALRQLKDKLQFKGRENFMTFFDRFRPSMDAPQEVDMTALRGALKDMNLNFSDQILSTLASNVGVSASGKVNYKNLTDALQWGRLSFMSMKVHSGRFRALAAPDPAQPLGNSKVDSAPFAVNAEAGGTAAAHVGKMLARIDAMEQALRKADADHDGRVSFREFHAALSEVSRLHRLHLGGQEITDLFRDYDTSLSGSIQFGALISKARAGAFPEYLRPRKERASQPQPPWKFDSVAVA